MASPGGNNSETSSPLGVIKAAPAVFYLERPAHFHLWRARNNTKCSGPRHAGTETQCTDASWTLLLHSRRFYINSLPVARPRAFHQVLGAPQFACFLLLLPPSPISTHHPLASRSPGWSTFGNTCVPTRDCRQNAREFMIYATKSKEPLPFVPPIDLCVPLADCLTANGSFCSQSGEISAGDLWTMVSRVNFLETIAGFSCLGSEQQWIFLNWRFWGHEK